MLPSTRAVKSWRASTHPFGPPESLHIKKEALDQKKKEAVDQKKEAVDQEKEAVDQTNVRIIYEKQMYGTYIKNKGTDNILKTNVRIIY